MSEFALRIENIKKSFSYHHEPPSSIKSVLVNMVKGKLNITRTTTFTVLNGVSFDVKPGEFVGIMGRNGAGKSTIFKLISGIYIPDEGSIKVNGRLAPLIELGAGFHHELSGYENIFLNAAILGFGRKVVNQALNDIIEFSELGEKIHMPVKNYSSGMLVRLGFSIAVHLPAAILLMDEVLAVGDVGFFEKSLKRVHDLHKSGRTIMLVTHSPEAVREHCQRCIVIDGGKKVFDGEPKAGTDLYLNAVHKAAPPESSSTTEI